MNELFASLGLGAWKPVISALILPPAPFLVLILVGGGFMAARRRLGWALLLLGTAGVWLSACDGAADWLERTALDTPPPLSPSQVADLRKRVKAGERVAIVVLGGGLESSAPEYGHGNLTAYSVARLRYGVWLARQTGAPLGYSGGVGWALNEGGTSEAEIAQRIARDELQLPLRWAEGESRDTRENALRSVELLRRDGVREVVLVSHGWHLPRGLRAFREASRGGLRITPAPTGVTSLVKRPVLRWMPTRPGFSHMHVVTHEIVGLLAGA